MVLWQLSWISGIAQGWEFHTHLDLIFCTTQHRKKMYEIFPFHTSVLLDYIEQLFQNLASNYFCAPKQVHVTLIKNKLHWLPEFDQLIFLFFTIFIIWTLTLFWTYHLFCCTHLVSLQYSGAPNRVSNSTMYNYVGFIHRYRKEIPELQYAVCNGVFSHGALIEGILVFCRPHRWKQMQTKCVHDLCLPYCVSCVFIFMLRPQ